MQGSTTTPYSPTWDEIDATVAKYTAVDMAKRLLELEHQSADGAPCFMCHGTGHLPISEETKVLAERAVEAQKNDKRTIEEKIRDGASFIMGPGGNEGTEFAQSAIRPSMVLSGCSVRAAAQMVDAEDEEAMRRDAARYRRLKQLADDDENNLAFTRIADAMTEEWDGILDATADRCCSFAPTHRHAEGGLYQMIDDTIMLHTGPDTWVPAVRYRAENGKQFLRAAADFERRFSPLASASTSTKEQGNG